MNAPPKIIFFSTDVVWGGAEEYIKDLAASIDEKNYTVRVAMPGRAATQPLLAFFKERQIPVDPVENQSKPGLGSFLGCRRYFRQHHPNIVHFNLNNPFECLSPILAAACCRIPYRIATEHCSPTLPSNSLPDKQPSRLRRRMVWFCLHAIITASKARKELLMQKYGIDAFRLKLIGDGIDHQLMLQQVKDLYDNHTAMAGSSAPVITATSAPRRKATLIVLTHDRKELLPECLNAVQRAVALDGGEHEIILIDNGSRDGTADFARSNYPQIRLVELEKNCQFARGNNLGVRCAKNEIVVLLNNDVIVEPDFLKPLLEGFQQPDVFAVTPQIFNYYPSKRREETGKTFGALIFGSLHVGHKTPDIFDNEQGYVPVFYAGGGSSAFCRSKFLELGGFDALYNPAYVEDADLSYRAWKSGYRVLFCPASKVAHKHRSTNMQLLGARTIDYYIVRNLFIFFWRNISSPLLWLRHFLLLPLHLGLEVCRGNISILKALAVAFLKSPQILLARVCRPPLARLTDREVFEATNSWFQYRHRYLPRPNGAVRPLRILVLSKRLPRLGVDGSWILVNLLRGLSLRHHVTLLSFVESENERPHIHHLESFCQRVKTIPLYPYCDELKRAYLFSKFLALLHALFLMWREVRRELMRGDYDLVQCEYLHTLNFIPDLGRFPSLLTHHEVLSLAHERSFRQAIAPLDKIKRLLKWQLTQAYEKRVCRKVKTIVALAEADLHYLREKLQAKDCACISSGIDLDYFTPQKECPEKPHSLLFVGYFKHPPNVEAMLYFFEELWPEMLSQAPDLKITIVGRHAPPELLAHNQTEAVTFIPYVPDLRPALASHTIFVAPIISGAGLRGKILEAMAMGKPVVATARSVEGYPFQHGKELMIAGSSSEFIACTLDLLSDPQRRQELGRNARAAVERRFSAGHFVAEYEALYQRLLGEKPNK